MITSRALPHLVLAGRLLTGLQLFQVPPTGLHVSLVLIKAPGESSSSELTARSTPGVLVIGCRLSTVVGLHVLLLLLLLGRRCGSATEETTDGVTDRRADSYTAEDSFKSQLESDMGREGGW